MYFDIYTYIYVFKYYFLYVLSHISIMTEDKYGKMFQCNNGIYLEPRLQEYIKKKTYYKKNKIKPSIPLEQEFSISKEDIKRLKAFVKGDRDLYEGANDRFQDENNVEQTFEFDADAIYKADPRYQRLLKKVRKTKEAMRMRTAYGELDADYENAFNPITNFEGIHDVREINDPPDTNMVIHNAQDELDINIDTKRTRQKSKYQSSYKSNKQTKSNRFYDHNTIDIDDVQGYNSQNITPKVNYRNGMYPMQNNKPQRLPIDHNPNIKNIIGELDTYRRRINDTYHYSNGMDTDFKVVIPNVRSEKKSLNSSYQPMPYMGMCEGIRDIDAESNMKCCVTTRGAKSFGYPNPAEHYFDYISNDIQDPDHVVLEYGIPTRLENHGTALDFSHD